MTTQNEVLYENDRYEVRVVKDALDEDNSSRILGYGIFNRTTKVREGTALVLGEARWRADQFRNMLRELDEIDQANPLEKLEGADEDVTLN